MSAGQTILEILKYILPAIIVLIACSLIVKRFLVNETERKRMALFQDSQDLTLRLRLQAYERLALYLERIHPRALMPKLYVSGMSALDLHQAVSHIITTEFEHNLSQQIYVSNQVWKTVQGVKEQELAMINHIMQLLPADASGKELHQRVVDFIVTNENDLPVEVALEVVNNEAKMVLLR